jgi:hypothetical protein
MTNLKEEIITHIHSHNKFLNREYLQSLTYEQLLCDVHPLNREYFEKKIEEETKEK